MKLVLIFNLKFKNCLYILYFFYFLDRLYEWEKKIFKFVLKLNCN